MSIEVTRAHAAQRANGVMSVIGLFVSSLRPREWIKNGFIFAALFFSQNLLNTELLAKTVLAFGLYCLAAGGVYVLNDISDRNEDRKHPQKSLRPIASGALPVAVAAPAAVFPLMAAVSGAFVMKPSFGFVTAAYVLLNILYSKWLKHLVILDVFSIAAGFVLRVVAGAVVIDVVMSHWLLICTLLLALFLGFSKRRYELVALADGANHHRRVLAEYNSLFLDMMIGIVTSATVVAYTFYTISGETVEKFQTDNLILTVPFVLYGIFRYLYLVYHKNKGWNPAHALLTDGPLLLNILFWGIVTGLILYTGIV